MCVSPEFASRQHKAEGARHSVTQAWHDASLESQHLEG